MKVDGEVPQEESFEIQSQKRKLIQVDSEETQDYVHGRWQSARKKPEETGFVPSAFREPRWPTHWCDNRCSEKAIRY